MLEKVMIMHFLPDAIALVFLAGIGTYLLVTHIVMSVQWNINNRKKKEEETK